MALEPLYSLDVAAELIPINRRSLDVILKNYKEKFPARYHNEANPVGRPPRMLTESECLEIRNMVVKLAGTRKAILGSRQTPYSHVERGLPKGKIAKVPLAAWNILIDA